ncbi:stalk domain-containing protein [Tissierella sp. Yu-01]|uniref:stalk domain-containing protein n=1 Tax=Tissierella sp. Yu-01 TaxID=3035694 RepID=UPI00240DF1CA|nr:stalk domain-containing protein [Tissierella sp. Yu-01]WFA08568.1 stalk domain-containing protein [Tissierella sp. Yu-01]
MKRFRRIFASLLVLVLVLSFASTTYADSHKNLRAHYKGIKIFRNDNMMKIDMEPFIIDGTTYVPLRSLAELLDKEVNWDGKNFKIHIKDKGGKNSELYKIIEEQKETIRKQDARIKELEKLLEKNDPNSELKDLEKRLNRDFGKYKDIEFEIKLEEKNTEIRIKIVVDFKDYKDELKDIRTEGFNEYLKNIINQVRKEFYYKAIFGNFVDTNKGNEILSFTLNHGNNVGIVFSVDRIEEMELLLHWKYSGSNGIKDIRLEEDDEIEITIYVDKNKWNDLKEPKQEEVLESIYKDIRKTFDEEIEGEIRNDSNGKTLYEFEYDRKGYVSIDD